MLTVTATFRAKKGHEETMVKALSKMAEYVQENEPGTVGYFLSRDASDPCVFSVYERFTDQAALDAHMSSQAAAGYFETVGPILDGEPTPVIGQELFAKD